jgi:hypothetical protein
VHVAHVQGQAPETFPAQALRTALGPGRSQDLPVGHASALESYGTIGSGDAQLHHTAFAASFTPSLLTMDAASRLAPLPDESGRAARLQEALGAPVAGEQNFAKEITTNLQFVTLKTPVGASYACRRSP